jgi:hypothetical protein
MRFIKGFAGFWYDFVIGDDWKIAAAVVASLGVGAVAVAAMTVSLVLPLIGLLVLVAFTVSLLVETRR